MAAEWYFRELAGEFGPFSPTELVQLASEGKIGPQTELRKGEGPWIAASRVAGLFDRDSPVKGAADKRAVAPPPIPDAPTPAPAPTPSPTPTTFQSAPAVRAGGLGGSANFEVLDEAESGGFRVEILAYPKLGGAKDAQTAATVYFANEAGIKLKQVRISLNKGEAIVESGALHFMAGRLQMESKIGGVSGLGKAMMNKFVTKEAAVMPRYRGTGQIYLEPSFSHFLIYRLCGEELIADKGMFYCAEGSLDIGSAMQKNVSSALFGGEGFFQTRIRGEGLCVLESPVPADEVLKVDLKDETLQVDGNFALMRTGRIEFSVEKSTRSLLGTLTSGEGLLQTFRGTGSVWLAPTQSVYHRLMMGGISGMGQASRGSHTAT
ncbi:AIM24 family protein [Singulisphaera sp. PoT]|uniref:AIM24 family protein n=1 Tax=Singulisphaera sp. PoT TaxID=3411797 RepID=UPI003BF47444